jgi:hypothetical protein
VVRAGRNAVQLYQVISTPYLYLPTGRQAGQQLWAGRNSEFPLAQSPVRCMLFYDPHFKTAFMRTKTLILLTLSFLTASAIAQTKELDEIKQVPFVDKQGMNIISTSLWTLYLDAIKTPEKTSTSQSARETVYAYYDRYSNGKLDKVNPAKGKMFSSADTADLNKNNQLLFNLNFDIEGNLIVPNKINVLSNRWSDGRNYGKRIGFIAVELNVTDSIKEQLAKVKLKRLAKADINSLTGSLSPVAIKLPFAIGTSQAEKIERIYGKVVKDKDRFQFSFTEAWTAMDIDGTSTASQKQELTEDLKNEVTEVLKVSPELSEYKNGTFTFVIEKRTPINNYNIDVNILRDNMVWSSETQSTSTTTIRDIPRFRIQKFEGSGKKIKK